MSDLLAFKVWLGPSLVCHPPLLWILGKLRPGERKWPGQGYMLSQTRLEVGSLPELDQSF